MRSLAAVEEWSSRDSTVHRIDPRVKLLCAVLFLAAIGIATKDRWEIPAIIAATCLGAGLLALLPPSRILTRALMPTAFTLPVLLIHAASGHAERAFPLVVRTYCSAVVLVVLIGTTPANSLFASLRSIGLPRVFVELLHFIYRAVFIAANEALSMRTASSLRGRVPRLAATRIIFSLFLRSQHRAERVHHAMLLRGYRGDLPLSDRPQFRPKDVATMVTALAVLLAAFAVRALL